ncbi:phospholipase A [bacterium]|nr:phospholipase A [bacterium]
MSRNQIKQFLIIPFILIVNNSIFAMVPKAAEDSNSTFLSSLEVYKPIYFLNTWFFDHEGKDEGYHDREIHLQFSFKKQVYQAVYFGYSHKAFWQTYDRENSRPFREQNYNPEVFLQFSEMEPLDLVRVGIWEHESNGDKQRYDEEGNEVNYSRTWDRFYLFGEKKLTKHLSLGLKLWIVTSLKTEEYRTFYDDNPDMQQYMGSGEIYVTIPLAHADFTVMLRRGWREGTDTIRVDGRVPVLKLLGTEDSGVDIFFQYFYGYGDSLIDYNRCIRRFSLGISFTG